ncbi:MAG: hypothetical protein E6G01_09265 [Actinobacteria bacterium]|nr:MAG: hypothetical protein E6G01_09265 [Actinomycetota bacterium]
MGLGLLLVAAIASACGGSSSSSSSASSTTSGAPNGQLLAQLGDGLSGDPVDGVACNTGEQIAYHVHAHLAVYVNGQPRAIPYGIGIKQPVPEQTSAGPFVVQGDCFYWIHVHDLSGVIHIESPTQRTYTLGQFFDVWGQPLSSTQVGPASGPVTAFVNGAPYQGDPRSIPLTAHQVIQLDVGTAVPPQPYQFPRGL